MQNEFERSLKDIQKGMKVMVNHRHEGHGDFFIRQFSFEVFKGGSMDGQMNVDN